MKRLFCLLLLFAACKSSSPEQEENRIAVITARILDRDITTSFRPEKFNGDITHISELLFDLGDTKRKNDTATREYLFRDGQLHQMAMVAKSKTGRTGWDTLTLRYDTAGRIQALIYSDEYHTYNTEKFIYDSVGRRIEKVNRIFTTDTRHVYAYNRSSDTLLITRGERKELLSFKEEGDVISVTRRFLNPKFVEQSSIEKYNSKNQLAEVDVFVDGKAEYKAILKYDDHGNLVRWEQHRGNHDTTDQFGEIDTTYTYTIDYEYDGKGNWTSRRQNYLGGKWSDVKERRFTYR